MGGATSPGPETERPADSQRATLARGGSSTPGAHGTGNGAQQQLALVGFPRTIGWNEFRKVSRRPPGVHEDALIATETSPGRASMAEDGNQWKLTEFKLRIIVNREQSWVVESMKSPELLAHEQGHFDIHGIIVGRDLLESLRRMRARSSQRLARQVRQAMQQAQREAQQFTNNYDDDTNHGLDSTRQAAWESMISNAINNNSRLSSPG